MSEFKAGELVKELKVPKRGRQEVNMTVWIDWQTRKELDLIAAYERKKRGPLMRDIIIEKIRCYERNPSFKSFLKRLREAKETEAKGGDS